MKLNFLYQITAASRTPDKGATAPQIPILSVLCPQLNLLKHSPPQTKFLGTPLSASTEFETSPNILIKGTGESSATSDPPSP